MTTPSPAELRREVREFLTAERAAGTFEPRCDSWLTGFDPQFSRRLGARGWLGLTWPAEYGGRGLTPLHRFAVTEELLAAGAPVAAHWMADRQCGPTILANGTEQQKRELLPRIAVGQLYFCIGLSEPDSGSDLASVRARADKNRDGWIVRGTKLWTSHAHHAHYMIGLFRTAPLGPDRHAGLSQFLIDMSVPGITVNPVKLIDGSHHFNEVIFDDVQVHATALLGAEGAGWQQVTQELTHERGGPERYLTTLPLAIEAIRRVGDTPAARAVAGRMTSELWALRELSIQIASGRSDRPAALNAAITKEIGTRLEQTIIDYCRQLAEGEADPGSDDPYQRLLAQAMLQAPGFTLRGGTTEVLRGIIAGLSGLR
jgi:alkylation response protein AidB-like acyl-CoA dehydrogenase